MTTLTGTDAEPLLDDRVTVTPPAPAAAASVTVPMEEDPPVTVAGLKLILPTVPRPAAGGASVSVVSMLFADVAVMVTGVEPETGDVDTVKVPLVCPGANIKLPGVVAEGLFEESVTVTPPAPAGALRATVPVVVDPPGTVGGLKLTLPMVPRPPEGGFTVRVAEVLTPEVAVIVAAVEVETAVVVTVKETLPWPAGTRTLAGTPAEPLLEDNEMVSPPAPAGAPRVTVPVEEDPPVTAAGFKLIPASAAGGVLPKF